MVYIRQCDYCRKAIETTTYYYVTSKPENLESHICTWCWGKKAKQHEKIVETQPIQLVTTKIIEKRLTEIRTAISELKREHLDIEVDWKGKELFKKTIAALEVSLECIVILAPERSHSYGAVAEISN